MFKFNFSVDNDEVDASVSTVETVRDAVEQLSLVEDKDKDQDDSSVTPACRVAIDDLLSGLPRDGVVSCEVQPGLRRRELSDIQFQLMQQDLPEKDWAVSEHSDLVSGVYEGGFKTWECTFDLIQVLDAAYSPGALNDRRVLELGCGAALPGIRLLQRHPTVQVDFQDYNDSVLRLVALPNLIVNTTAKQPSVEAEADSEPEEAEDQEEGDEPEENDDDDDEEADEADDDDNDELKELQHGDDCYTLPSDTAALGQQLAKRSQFFAGDWSSLPSVLGKPGQYHVVITAETIYHEANHARLHDVIQHALHPDGVAYLAAKSVYFGCTGSMHTFLQHIQTRNVFAVQQCHLVDQNVRREVIQLSFRAPSPQC